MSSEERKSKRACALFFRQEQEVVNYMIKLITKHRRWRLAASILSLSLLTVMAGAAVAPALNLIQEHFRDTDPIYVQMIISMPAVFIALTNLFLFKPLSKRLRARTMLLIGLGFYVVFGCLAGAFSDIRLILICRGLVGIGVGILMPLSTGLISFYFTKDKQAELMGYASAMNMLGGVVATLIAGGLAMVSWRFSFLVYLLGLISVVLCLFWMPNERIYDSGKDVKEKGVFRRYLIFVVAMFLVMVTFFIYPADFVMETAKQGIIPQRFIAVIMAAMDVFGFFGGLASAPLRKGMGRNAKFSAPVFFLVGYLCLRFAGGWTGVLVGSFMVGFANGVGVPYVMTAASMQAGRSAATTVMPMLSVSLYTAQFVTPFIISAVKALTLHLGLSDSSYTVAVITAVLLFACCFAIREPETKGDKADSEKCTTGAEIARTI